MNMADETKPRPAPEPAPDAGGSQETYAPPPRGKRRRILIMFAAAALVLVAALWLWRHLSSYESTDDAQADVHLYPVSARVAGYVVRVNVNDNQWVNKGDVLVEIDPTDYQVALSEAQANLSN